MYLPNFGGVVTAAVSINQLLQCQSPYSTVETITQTNCTDHTWQLNRTRRLTSAF